MGYIHRARRWPVTTAATLSKWMYLYKYLFVGAGCFVGEGGIWRVSRKFQAPHAGRTPCSMDDANGVLAVPARR